MCLVPDASTQAAVDVASTAAYSIVKDSVFGALLLIAVVGIIWLIRRLLAVQDLRVADQVRANELMERTRDKTAALMEQVLKASSSVDSALEDMSEAQETQANAIRESRTAIQQVQTTMDSIIRDAVRRRSTPASNVDDTTPVLRREGVVGNYSYPKQVHDQRRGR